MENQKEHHELLTKMAVFEERMAGKLDGITSHLAMLNSKTSKNTASIEHLEKNDRDIFSMVYAQNKVEKERHDARDGIKNRFTNLLFGTLQYLIPGIILSILIYGNKIAEFLGLT